VRFGYAPPGGYCSIPTGACTCNNPQCSVVRCRFSSVMALSVLKFRYICGRNYFARTESSQGWLPGKVVSSFHSFLRIAPPVTPKGWQKPVRLSTSFRQAEVV
jgi:hypothetical protein